MKIIFFGTPDFGAIILEGLINSQYKPILVVTNPDRPAGRKQILTSPPVKILAEKYKIPLCQPENLKDLKEKIKNFKPDLGIAASYGKIIPKDILTLFRHGCLNVHPSLLPKYRGPSPIQSAILNGEKKTGVTIILLNDKMDHGPILAMREWEIRNPKSEIRNKSQIPRLRRGFGGQANSKITYSKLHNTLAKLGTELLVETIPRWIKGKIKPVPQDDSKATYTKIMKKEDGKINWQKPAEVIERQIRAFEVWPGSYFFWKDKNKIRRIKVERVRILKSNYPKNYPIGKTLVAPQNELCVQTGKDFLIIEKLQLEGKREMASEDFLRGHPDFIGTILE